jgi:hypothetical protein
MAGGRDRSHQVIPAGFPQFPAGFPQFPAGFPSVPCWLSFSSLLAFLGEGRISQLSGQLTSNQLAHPPPPHTPPQWGDFNEGRYREDGQVLSLPPPWPPRGLMWLGRVHGSPTLHQAAPPPPHLLAYWQCTGPVRQKGCGCECSWSRGRVRRR